MCMTIDRHARVAHDREHRGIGKADTSLTRSAPASIASRATPAFIVSTDTRTCSSRLIARMTGRRAGLFVLRDGEAPGRVLSPPTSMKSAPSSTIRAPLDGRGPARTARRPRRNRG
jgi:hypothetical protein